MVFKWADYLSLAEELNSLCSSDKNDKTVYAKLRTVISRAYYATFHISKEYFTEYLESKNIFLSQSVNVHSDLINALIFDRSSQSSRIKMIGDILNELRKIRNKADYSLNCEELDTKESLQKEAKIAIQNSFKVIRIIKSLGNTSSKIP
jgi:uncharacterized protein (UPF0332 family)